MTSPRQVQRRIIHFLSGSETLPAEVFEEPELASEYYKNCNKNTTDNLREFWDGEDLLVYRRSVNKTEDD